MKKVFTLILAAFFAATATINAQNDYRSKKLIFPVIGEMTSDTTAMQVSNTSIVVEKKFTDKANGENITVTIEKDNKVIRTIHSASRDTRFVKGIGYAALQTDNFILLELRNRDGEWYMDTRTRNRFGRNEPLLNGQFY